MERRQRLVFAAIAVAIAVVAVIVLAGGDAAEEEPGPVATATATPAAPEEASPRETPEPTPEPTPEVPEIVVEGGEVQGGVAEIEVRRGETVRFAVRSDAPDHVHVHGYDRIRDVGPGRTARFSFRADIVGIFEVELEESGVQVARLRVDQ